MPSSRAVGGGPIRIQTIGSGTNWRAGVAQALKKRAVQLAQWSPFGPIPTCHSRIIEKNPILWAGARARHTFGRYVESAKKQFASRRPEQWRAETQSECKQERQHLLFDLATRAAMQMAIVCRHMQTMRRLVLPKIQSDSCSLCRLCLDCQF